MSVDADIDALAAHDLLASAAHEARALALDYFRPGARASAQVETKVGGSPVTAADLAADSLLKRRLRDALPEAGWLSEETIDDFERLACRSLIVVDPIDGTRAFVIGDPHWAVPPRLSSTGGRSQASSTRRRSTKLTPPRAAPGRRSTAPRSPPPPSRRAARRRRPQAHYSGDRGETRCSRLPITPRVPSLAYRLCMAARRAVDFAVAAENSHDWDIAAADLLLEEAGARLIDASGERLLYDARHVRRGALLAAPEAAAPKLIEAFRAAIGWRPN